MAPIVLIALVLATTGHRFANGFVFDDAFVIERGEVIHDPTLLPEAMRRHTLYISAGDMPDGEAEVDTYRPVTVATFFWDAAIGGRSPWAYHLTNLLLHMVCVLLLYSVGLSVLGRDNWMFASLGGAIFATSPWTAEAHVWINGRSDPCGLAFGLVGVVLALGTTRPLVRAVALMLTFLAALLSKEVLLGAAPSIALTPWLLRTGGEPRVEPRRLAWTIGPVVLATLIYLVIRYRVLGGMRAQGTSDTLWIALLRLPVLLVDGLSSILLPRIPYLRSLRDAYVGLPLWVSIAATLLIVLICWSLWRARRNWPIGIWSALWFGGTLAPVAVITTVLWPGFGRYLYIPCAAVALAIASAAATLYPKLSVPMRRVGVAFVTLFLTIQAVLLVDHTTSYQTEVTLYSRAIEMNPEAAYGWGYLGLSLKRAGQSREAVVALKEAIGRDPSEQRYRAKLAHLLVDMGNHTEARDVALAGADDFGGTPEAATFHLALARSLPARDPEQVVLHLVRCLELRPGRTDCQIALRHLMNDARDSKANRFALESLLGRSEHETYRSQIECAALERCEVAE